MKKRNEIIRSLAMVTQLGLSMLAPIVMCAFIGVWLDEKFGWSVTAVLLVLGVMAGARNTWVLVKQVQASDAADSKRRQKDEQEDQ